MIINNLVTKHTKSFASKANLIKAVEKVLGEATTNNTYDLIIIVNEEGRFQPIIKWRRNFEYRTIDSVSAQFYTVN